MRFGIFGGAARSPASDGGDSQAYGEFIDMVLEAEQLGFDSVFLVEHHFTGLGQVSASLSLLTYLAGKTSTLRLGTAVTVLPWHNPVLLAEQAATLDLLSNGRLELGVGKGYRPNEFHGFGIDPTEATARYEECLAVLLEAWRRRDRFSHAGRYWTFNDIVVEPDPIQQRPPFWTGAGSEASIREAARRDLNLLLDQFGSPDLTAQRLAWFADELERLGRPPGGGRPRVAVARPLLLVEPGCEARLEREYDLRVAGIRALRESSRIPGDDTPLTTADHAFYNDARDSTVAAAIAGTPDECVKQLEQLQAAGVEEVIFNDPIGGIARLRHFAREVMPAFAG